MTETKRDRVLALIAIATAIASFRILEPLTRILLKLLGLARQPFIHTILDYEVVLTPAIAVGLAVLISRALERRMSQASHKAKIITCIIAVILALQPLYIRIHSHIAEASELESTE